MASKKTQLLEKATSDYMDVVSNLFPKDEDADKQLSSIELSAEDKKWLDNSDLDSLSRLVIASILGY